MAPVESRARRLRRLEERLERRQRIFRIPLVRLKDRENPLELYNSVEFKRRYHMFKDTALFIADMIKSDLCWKLKRGTFLPPIIQLTTVLRYYATGSFQLVIADLNSVCQGTVSNLIKRVSIAVAERRPRFIKYPSQQEAPLVRQKFFSLGGFPGVVGCIDGCQVEIKSPGGPTVELFRNRKDDYAINVQGVCDSELNFTNIVARWYGSAHDSRVFENSTLCMDLESGKVPGLLLGDSGYSCLPFLMPPLASPKTRPEKRYQKAHLTTRNTIERTFGIWKRRYPCLNKLKLKLETCLTVIVATAVLLNISRARLDIYENDEYDPVEDDDDDNDVGFHNSTLGRAVQRSIIDSHFT